MLCQLNSPFKKEILLVFIVYLSLYAKEELKKKIFIIHQKVNYC